MLTIITKIITDCSAMNKQNVILQPNIINTKK